MWRLVDHLLPLVTELECLVLAKVPGLRHLRSLPVADAAAQTGTETMFFCSALSVPAYFKQTTVEDRSYINVRHNQTGLPAGQFYSADWSIKAAVNIHTAAEYFQQRQDCFLLPHCDL